MELRIKKDLKYIRHKSKIFSQTNVLNFENKISKLRLLEYSKKDISLFFCFIAE